MKALAYPFISILGLCALLPSVVSAQDFTLTVTQIGDEEFSGSSVLALANASHCADDAAVEITISGSGTLPAQLDVWRGAASANCHLRTSRESTTSTACTWAGHFDVTAMLVGDVSVADLIGDSSVCNPSTGSSVGTDVTFTAIGTNTSMDRTTETPYGTFTIRFDAVSPNAPTVDDDDRSVSGGSVPVRWTEVTSSSEMVRYVVYVDPMGTCGDGGPASDLLVPGEPAPDSGAVTFESSGSSRTLSAEDVGLSVPSTAVAAVATIDLSKNTSELSDLICINFVDTQGFCEGDMPDCHENCSVAAPGAGGDARGLVVLCALACAALVVHARRRRSAP